MRIYQIIQRSERAKVRLAYRLKYGKEKLARAQNHLTFLMKCRNNHRILNILRVSLPAKLSNQRKANEIVRKASKALLRVVIGDIRRKKA